MRPPAFEEYIAEARPYSALWRLALGLALILLMQAGFIALMLALAFPAMGEQAFLAWLADMALLDAPGDVLFLLAGFIGLGGAVLIVAPACHFRGPGTLFGPARAVLRGFWAAVLWLAPIYGALLALGWAFLPPEANLPLARWLSLLPFALPLVLVQTAAEEVLFRGYFMQQLAARFTARAIFMGLPALIFTALHANPGLGLPAALAMMAPVFAFALAAADLTLRSGNLGRAMGWHFINNCSAILVVSVKGTITGLALYVTPYGLEDGALPFWASLGNVVMVWLMWRVLRWAAER